MNRTVKIFPHLNHTSQPQKHRPLTRRLTIHPEFQRRALIRASWKTMRSEGNFRLSSFLTLSNRRRSLSRFSKRGGLEGVFPSKEEGEKEFVHDSRSPRVRKRRLVFSQSRCKIVYAPAVEAERLNRFSRTPVAIKTDTKVESNSVEIYPDGEAVIWPRWANLVSKRRANIPRL